jgi:pimeloyl-ACP methyl ester carboxylesterase
MSDWPVTQRQIHSNGIRMRLAEAGPGDGPRVLLAHGWPESWYSWRRQLPVLAAAGYRAIAPDLRGYGGTEAPATVAAYDIFELVADLVGVLDEDGAQQAAVIGHDWGAVVAWHCALLRPERFRAVAALSVPHFGRPHEAPTRIWQERFGDRFCYILYHQREGVAEREYDADPEGLLRMLYAAPDTPRDPPAITDPHRGAGGWIGRMGRPQALPPWLSEAELAWYVGEFRRTGFRGGLNYYRNLDRNWERTAGVDPVVRVPALFIAGSADPTVAHLGAGKTRQRMAPFVPELRDFVWLEGAGHWIQQERSEDCNRILIDFLNHCCRA